ncbi:MAG: hypothetical protein HC902_10850, partial [Calothrix sp. SM1_5_4]|nr:hypothetical protein [Calothrix sp. SM1_5_4]
GKDRRFRVRQGDEFKHLEELAEQLRPIIAHAVEERKRLEIEKSVGNG